MLSLRTGILKLVRAEIFYTGNVDKGLLCGNIKNDLTRSTRYNYNVYGLTTLNKPKSREVSTNDGIITQNIFNAAVPTSIETN